LQLRQIPGVGPYTAAAVASIAFNDRAAAVDGNVIRVCARLRALRGNPTKMTKVWDKLAAQLLHPERPGCHNQVHLLVKPSTGIFNLLLFLKGGCTAGGCLCGPVGPSCQLLCILECVCPAFAAAPHQSDKNVGQTGCAAAAPRATRLP
jgi:hypothetical protein